MTSYGLPLRFKAVITTDRNENRAGECSKIFSIDSDVRGNEFSSPLRAEIWWDNKLPRAVEYKIYQSTGHHDAKGAEVFFGDVLSDGQRLYEVIYHCGEVLMSVYQQENAPVYPAQYFKNARLIGNIYTPPAELQRRAQDAQEVLSDA